MDTPCEVPSQEQEAEEEGMKPPLELANTVVALLDAANEVVDVEFLASGGYNYVWKVTFCKVGQSIKYRSSTRLLTDKPQKLNRTIPRRDTSIQILVLRLPRQGPSLPPYQLRNEVAFLDYISRKLPNIPVPKVYAYEDGTDPDTIPFIAEEFIEGSNLEDVWFELPVEKKRSLCQRLADIVLDLAETRFTAIGGLDLNLNAAPTVQGGKIFKGRVSVLAFCQST